MLRRIIFTLLFCLFIGIAGTAQTGLLPMMFLRGRVPAGMEQVNLWKQWNELTETGLQSVNTFVVMMENTSAGGNELGQGGGLTGVDPVLTQNGGVPGATGSPPKRLVNRAEGDWFDASAATLKRFYNGKTFTYVIKCNTMYTKGGVIEFYDGTRHLLCDTDGRFYTAGYTTNSDVSWTTDPTLPTGDIYFALWDDGTTTYWGWTTTKPTKLSDFAAANRISKASINGTHVTMTRYSVFGTSNTALTLRTYGYYIVMSDFCLIDNNS